MQVPVQQIHGGLLYSPFSSWEAAAYWSYISEEEQENYVLTGLSLKYQFPRYMQKGPYLSIGVMDVFQNREPWQNMFFVARQELPFSEWLLALDIGAIYFRSYNPYNSRQEQSEEGVRSFFNLELDWKRFNVLFEQSYSEAEGWLFSPWLWWRIWHQGDWANAQYIAIGAGYQETPSSAVAAEEVAYGLNANFSLARWGDTLRLSPDEERVFLGPWLYHEGGLFLNRETPLNDSAFTSLRWRHDWVLRLGSDALQWINGTDFFLMTNGASDNKASEHQTTWNRSYLQYTSPFSFSGRWGEWHPAVLRAGYLQKGQAGAVLDFFWNWPGWSKVWLQNKTVLKEYDSYNPAVNVYLEAPLHPQFSGWLSQTQLALRGGWNNDQEYFGGLEWQQQLWRLAWTLGVELDEKQVMQVSAGITWAAPWIVGGDSSDVNWEMYLPGRTPQNLSYRSGNWQAGSAWQYAKPWVSAGNERWKKLTKDLCSPDWYSWEEVSMREECADKDYDLDGLINRLDSCPRTPEDNDGFEDENGCPDLDNDNDRIPDLSDSCAMEAEDIDFFEDGDGCPDWDNDDDAIMDVHDKCPLDREDSDGFEDRDGCPDPDNDGDGIEDRVDRCPMQAEDFNSYADEDGCPDARDKDRIPDHLDACPAATEDFDGFEDFDGCPELDNDSDLIPDSEDRCPNAPENLNGVEDSDGCPEE
jgi:hypothetical protein